MYNKGAFQELRYDPTNPQDADILPSARTLGFYLIVAGVLLVVAVWINWWIKRRFKFAAAAGGVGDAYNMFIR